MTKIEYNDSNHVEYADGFYIMSDKHAFQCKKCGAIFQSKNIFWRTIFATDDPRCKTCDESKHDLRDLKRICKCEEII